MTASTPLRLWPGVILAIVIVVLRFIVPVIEPEAFPIGLIAAAGGSVLILLWWLFLSKAPWSERLGILGVVAAAVVIIRPLLHESIAGGMMDRMFYAYALPSVLGPAIVAWAAVSRRFSTGLRWASMVATMLLACGVWTLVRTEGVLGARAQLAWRWTPTAEERLLAQGEDATKPLPAPAAAAATSGAAPKNEPPPASAAVRPDAAATPGPATTRTPVVPSNEEAGPAAADPAGRTGEWPGFRGANRDSIVRGVRIATDWTTSPPVQVWRRPIGPGWSSFAVSGDLLYTQEQRGEEEMISCYRVSTGEPVWRHRDSARFWESNGGAGPRGTPTLAGGRVYAFGATGLLNALDAKTGAAVWHRDVAKDTGRGLPEWGFSSSPLVVDDVVVVAASGTMAGYDATTGEQRWVGPAQRGSYSSPHLATIDGVRQIVLLTGSGAAGFAPATGAVLWKYDWEGATPIVQPALTADGDVLINAISMMGGLGTRRLAVDRTGETWRTEERWMSNGLKPYFNDFVIHEGHAYGFDGSILAAIDLTDGTRKWKGGRYGNGQLVLLAEQDLLFVVSEEGELALVSATPDQYRELARAPGIEGKTWNHPVIVGTTLLVRNGEEMAAFRLTPASR